MESDNRSDLSDQQRIEIINDRVHEMSALYLKWSQSAKFRYRSLSVATISFSAAVPVVVLVAPLVQASPNDPWIASIAGILGACATLAKSVDLLFKSHETWMRNNDCLTRLHSEKFLFDERAGAYKTLTPNERISLYAEHINAVIAASTTSWSSAETASQGSGA